MNQNEKALAAVEKIRSRMARVSAGDSSFIRKELAVIKEALGGDEKAEAEAKAKAKAEAAAKTKAKAGK